MVFAIDRHDADDRTEAFFHHHAHGVVNIDKHSGWEEIPWPWQPPPARDQFRAAAHGLIDLGFHKVHRLALRERAYSRGGILGIAQFVFFDLGYIGVHKFREE